MANNTIYILSDTVAECIMPNGTARDITIPKPNDPDKPYEVIWRKLRVQDRYRDPLYRPREGHNKFEFEFVLAYDHHKFHSLHYILIADRINLKVPTYLYEDNTYYKDVEVQCLNDQFSDKPYRGMKFASGNTSWPNDSEVLRFRTDPYEWSEFEDEVREFSPIYLVGDDGELILGFAAGSETDDGEGVEAVAFEPAEYGSEQTYNYSFGPITTINLESNND